MNISKGLTLVSLTLTLALAPASTATSARSIKELRANYTQQQQSQQSSTGALERGYRTGYSDGFQAGYADTTENALRDYSNKEDYRRADRAYVGSYGTLEDYRDGYRQGFQVGYNAGFDHRGFDSTVPSGLSRTQGTANSQPDTNNEPADETSSSSSSSSGRANTTTANQSPSDSSTSSVSNTTGGMVVIPSDTVMRVELLTNLSSDASQRGDRFQARVIEPREYAGAIIDGRVTRVKRAGKVRGTSELQLTIEQIRLTDNRSASISGLVTDVLASGSTGVGQVDPEGGVRGRDKTKDDVSTIGASTGVGAIIGAIAGGGKGAAIGAAIGGAIGTGRVLTSSGGDIHLTAGQQLRIRTASETRIP